MSLTPLKELMVLSTLYAHPMHGYALADILDQGLGWTVGLTRPTVYATLRRFVDRGWIHGEPERDGRYPEREVFRVTAQGEAAYVGLVRDCAAHPTEGTHPVAALLVHLDGVAAADQRRAVTLMLQERRRRVQTLHAFPRHAGLAGQALDLLRRQVQAEIETLESVLHSEPQEER